jgi:c-di-GMP-binding flagellar brake protein YcgR
MSESHVAPEVAQQAADRRRFPRHRYSAPIVVRLANAPEARGMSLEISECGMSAVVGAALKVCDRVELEPVGVGAATAVVRRTLGNLCGFEFLNLSSEQAGKIREMCVMLPRYHSRTLDLWKRCESRGPAPVQP